MLSKAELFVVVAVRTQEDGEIGEIHSASLKFSREELFVEIASIDFLIAVLALFSKNRAYICPVFSSSKFLLAATSTASSKEGRN